MAFDAQLIHWPTISAFTAYLQGVPRPKWCRRLCNHNTYKPDETTWRGMASMRSMRDFYRDTQKWPSGPHLFLAAHAPDPADTGIFQLTPITHPGTHAGPCNADALGLESVGNFNARPPTNEQYTLLLAVNRAILVAWGMPPASVVVHRDCMPGRICPGKYLTSAQIRASLNEAWPRRYRVRGLPVYEQSDRDGPQWGVLKNDEIIEIDDMSNGHLSDGRGFIRFDPDTLEAI